MKLNEFAGRLEKISNKLNIVNQIKQNCPPVFGDYPENLQREAEQEFDDLWLEWREARDEPSPVLGDLILEC